MLSPRHSLIKKQNKAKPLCFYSLLLNNCTDFLDVLLNPSLQSLNVPHSQTEQPLAVDHAITWVSLITKV